MPWTRSRPLLVGVYILLFVWAIFTLLPIYWIFVTSIKSAKAVQGPRPTFQDGRRILEAHLFDFEGDLYDEWVRIEWVERLRDIERFPSLEHLQEQLKTDRKRAVVALAGRSIISRASHA